MSANDQVIFEVSAAHFSEAKLNLQRAIGLLGQVKGAVPPYFLQRIEACIAAAMDELGMEPRR